MAKKSNMAGSKANQAGKVKARPASMLSIFFSHAFRPFFLGAGLYAVLGLSAWLTWIAIHAVGAMPAFMTVAEPLHLWHAHEMVFGFGAAAVGGFLLTAIPNWTGASSSKGLGLGLMFALWCAGRTAMWMTALLPPAIPMFFDMAYLPVLGFAAGRQLAVQPAMRNVIFFSLILSLVTGNFLYHLDRMDLIDNGMQQGVQLGLGTLIVMIVVIGGRVIPGFTTNTLRRQGYGDDKMPVRRAPVDLASLVFSAATIIFLVLGLADQVIGFAALIAAFANAVRLSGWRGLATLKQPIVWVLHLGYSWIVAGFALLAAAHLADWGSEVSALHAFGTGAAGTMILAIMTRASLGHTGRALTASRPIIAAYVLVSVAAVLRCFGPLAAPQLYNEIMLAAGLAWITAFTLFTIVFAPILLGPRVQSRS
jgi:uncharacterized protein involved in response to NO